MEKIFRETERFESDFYIGDYTHYAESHPAYLNTGVVMSNRPLVDINALHVNLICSNIIEIRTHQHVKIE